MKLMVINNSSSSIVIIKGLLNFTYVENTGGAYGFGANYTIVITILNIFVIGSILSFVILKQNKLEGKVIVGSIFIIAGGIGNLIDRIFRGYVVDYIDINPLFKYPIFNLADIFIVLGSIILVIGVILSEKKEKLNESVWNKKRRCE